MPDDPPILDYAKQHRGMHPLLRLFLILLCCTGLLVGFLVLVFGIFSAIESILHSLPPDRGGDIFECALIALIGLVVIFASFRWFIAAVRAE